MNARLRPLLLLVFAALLACTTPIPEPVVAVGALDPAPTPPGWTTGTLDVMSFNLRWPNPKDGANTWPRRRDIVLDLLRNHPADVIGTQELHVPQVEEVLRSVPHLAEVGGRTKPRTPRVAILYRQDRLRVLEHGAFWISATPERPSTGFGTSQQLPARWARFQDRRGGRTFYVFNVHFAPRGAVEMRWNSLEVLVDRIQGRRQQRDPVIVTGDFNMSSSSRFIKYFTGKMGPPDRPGRRPLPPLQFVDAYERVHPHDLQSTTFHMFKGHTVGGRIDFVLTSPAVEVLDASIIRDNRDGQYPSDHYPVTARVKLPAMTGPPPGWKQSDRPGRR